MVADAIEQGIRWLLESPVGPLVLVMLIGVACVLFLVFLIYTAGSWLIEYAAKWPDVTWRMIAIIAFIASAASFLYKGPVVAFFAGLGALVSVATVKDALRKLAEREENKKIEANSTADSSSVTRADELDE